MAHQITERADGTAEAAFAFNPAWHGLGTVVDKAPNSTEMLKLAQLDWSVLKVGAYAAGSPDRLVKTGIAH